MTSCLHGEPPETLNRSPEALLLLVRALQKTLLQEDTSVRGDCAICNKIVHHATSYTSRVKPSGSAALIIQLSQHRCKGSCMVQMSVMSWIAQLHSKFETARPNLPVRLGRRVLEAPPHNICITLHHHASKGDSASPSQRLTALTVKPA
ncbi:hypothetical protein ABBQ38_009566 [Trebouxia sp. C0009 RCD-2024]